jgi:hypothetical protein
MMAGVALLVCLLARAKPHQRWRALLLITLFGLCPAPPARGACNAAAAFPPQRIGFLRRFCVGA